MPMLSCITSEDSCKGPQLMNIHFADDERVKYTYYTGLPTFAILMTVLNFVSPFVGVTQKKILSKFEMIVVLMRFCTTTGLVISFQYFCVDCRSYL